MLDIYVLEDNIIQQFRMEREIATLWQKIIGTIRE